MTYKHITTLDTSKDFILPCRKDQLDTIKEFLPVDQPDFDGSFSTYLLLYGKDGNRIYLLGLGEDKHSAKLENTFYKLAFETQKHWDKSIQVYAENLNEDEIRKSVIGLEMAQYAIGEFKSEKEKQNKTTVSFSSTKAIKKIVDEGKYTGETINKIKALIDAPPNIKTPEYLGKWAKESAKNGNYKCTVLKEKQLEKQGFDAVLSVGKGSVNKPVVIITEYKPKTTNKVDITLVGKGITFDSGGTFHKTIYQFALYEK